MIYTIHMARLGQRIKELREAKHWSQADVAKAVGISPSYVARMEEERIKLPSREVLEGLAQALCTTQEDLLQAAGYIPGEPRPRSPDAILAELVTLQPVAIPVYEQVVHAGEPAEIVEYSYWAKSKAVGKNIRGFKVRGFCLSPMVNEGDTIFVDPDRSPQNGNIVLALANDEVYLMRFRCRGDKVWLENNDRELELEECLIQGVVVQVSKELI
jgi:transcriptional regulator with XRE-family HTH domain